MGRATVAPLHLLLHAWWAPCLTPIRSLESRKVFVCILESSWVSFEKPMLILSFKFPVSKRHQFVFFMLEDGLVTTASRPNPDVSTAQEELGPKFEAVAAAKKRLSSETIKVFAFQPARVFEPTEPPPQSIQEDEIKSTMHIDSYWLVYVYIYTKLYKYIWLGHF